MPGSFPIQYFSRFAKYAWLCRGGVRKNLQNAKTVLELSDMKNFASIVAFVFLSAFCGTLLCAAPSAADENAALKEHIAKLELQVKELKAQMQLEREVFAKAREENRELRKELRRLKRNAVEAQVSAPAVIPVEKSAELKSVDEAAASLKSRRLKKEEDVEDMDTEPPSSGFKMFPF